MTNNEMRFIRRDQINKLLQKNNHSAKSITFWVRLNEIMLYGHTMRIYWVNWNVS